MSTTPNIMLVNEKQTNKQTIKYPREKPKLEIAIFNLHATNRTEQRKEKAKVPKINH